MLEVNEDRLLLLLHQASQCVSLELFVGDPHRGSGDFESAQELVEVSDDSIVRARYLHPIGYFVTLRVAEILDVSIRVVVHAHVVIVSSRSSRRRFLLCNCDMFTKSFFHQYFGQFDFTPINIDERRARKASFRLSPLRHEVHRRESSSVFIAGDRIIAK